MPSILNSDDGVVSGTSGLKTTGGNDGLLNIQTNGSNAISISSGQRSTFPTTIGVGGATPSTSGSGISFPATQSASTDANTLDDYEEGTWTPTDASGAGLTFTVYEARYFKIGKLVTLWCDIAWPSTANGNSAKVGGLPFTTATSSGSPGGMSGFYSTLATNSPFGGYFGSNATTFVVYNNNGGANAANSALSTKELAWIGSYIASA